MRRGVGADVSWGWVRSDVVCGMVIYINNVMWSIEFVFYTLIIRR